MQQARAPQPRKLDIAAVETVERGSFALLDYLARMLAGKPVSPLALFPQYRALQDAGRRRPRASGRPVAASTGSWRDLPADAGVAPRAADAAARTARRGADCSTLMRAAAERGGRAA